MTDKEFNRQRLLKDKTVGMRNELKRKIDKKRLDLE